jgi:hypothetical protein
MMIFFLMWWLLVIVLRCVWGVCLFLTWFIGGVGKRIDFVLGMGILLFKFEIDEIITLGSSFFRGVVNGYSVGYNR